jgi:hypothetical protein
MRADYDSTANAISIAITDAPLAGGRPVEVQLLYPEMGITEPLTAVAERYDLDREALLAAAQSAFAAPDRLVILEVAARASA